MKTDIFANAFCGGMAVIIGAPIRCLIIAAVWLFSVKYLPKQQFKSLPVGIHLASFFYSASNGCCFFLIRSARAEATLKTSNKKMPVANAES